MRANKRLEFKKTGANVQKSEKSGANVHLELRMRVVMQFPLKERVIWIAAITISPV
jgi:hypothetical protein